MAMVNIWIEGKPFHEYPTLPHADRQAAGSPLRLGVAAVAAALQVSENLLDLFVQTRKVFVDGLPDDFQATLK